MKITIITLFPDMIKSFFAESIIKRAQDKELVTIEIINLRDFALDSYGSVDDRPYGGGAGMVLRVEPLVKALNSITNYELRKTNDPTSSTTNVGTSLGAQHATRSHKVILTSAKGKTYNQKIAQEYAKEEHLIFIAGHYEGPDERVLQYVDEEISIGDFVMTGGEIAIAAIVDSVVRLIPGVLKKETATEQESFMNIELTKLISVVGETELLKKLKEKNKTYVSLLESPHYTRPQDFKTQKVPEILLSGDPKKIEEWQLQKAYEETVAKRPDLLT